MSPKIWYAAIDVGSNSIKVLGADASGSPVPDSYLTKTVRLQTGLDNGCLSEESLRRADETIGVMVAYARGLGAERVTAFGTSALRDARNAEILAQSVWKNYAVRLRVISGEEEAACSLWAVSPKGRTVVVNIGGGSTEVISGCEDKVENAVSIHIGAVSLMKLSAGSMEMARAYAEEALDAALKKKDISGLPVVLSGGIASCSAGVLSKREKPDGDEASSEGFVLKALDAEAFCRELFSMTLEERRNLPGMPQDRADIAPYGMSLVCAFAKLSGAHEMKITRKSTLYGMIKLMKTDL